jgi:hypothetical protein
MKSFMAKALTVAVLAGGSVAVAAAPSLAASGLPVGASVTGHGVGGTVIDAEDAAILDANGQCASGSASLDGEGWYSNYASGNVYYSVFHSVCAPTSVNG